MNKFRVMIVETDGISCWEDCYIVKSSNSNLSKEEARQAIGINSYGYWPEIAIILPLN